MKKLILASFILLWVQLSLAESYDSLLDSITEPMPPLFSKAVIRSIDLVNRKIIIGGYEYYVGPSYGEAPLEVSLYGTSAGAFELLSVDMKVEVEYIDFGHARVAFEIKQLSPGEEVEH